MGDWNAGIGNDENKAFGFTGIYGEKTINKNGQKVLEFGQKTTY